MKKSVVSRVLIRASHSLVLSDERSEAPHGHHYGLDIYWKSAPKELEGALDWFEQEVTQQLDGKRLNEFFKQSSGEGILEWIAEKIEASPYRTFIKKIGLKETQKNYFELVLATD